MSTLQGSCLCGAITFDVRDAQMLVECHCTRCRKWTGCSSLPAVVAPATGLVLTVGEALLGRYVQEGFSPRHFCTRCGTSLYSGARDVLYVNAGVLADPGLDVACHIQVADKAPWHEIGGGAPQYAAMPG
jgi:hypothetical protein